MGEERTLKVGGAARAGRGTEWSSPEGQVAVDPPHSGNSPRFRPRHSYSLDNIETALGFSLFSPLLCHYNDKNNDS